MKIAVTSQNRRTVTEHAGRCRKFWVYDIEQQQVTAKTLLEIALEQTFHEAPPHEPHPLDQVQVLISASIGPGLYQRLTAKGIEALATLETDPDQAVAAYLQGSLPLTAIACSDNHGPDEQDHHHHSS